MEWLAIANNITSDRFLLSFMDSHTILTLLVFTVLTILVKRTKTDVDDKLLDALKGKVKLVKK